MFYSNLSFPIRAYLYLQTSIHTCFIFVMYAEFLSVAEIVLAVPHVHRPKSDYLLQTVTSLFSNMSPEQRDRTAIVVMVAEPWNETQFELVVSELKPK